MADLTTLSLVKQYLALTGSTSDAEITTAISATTAMIQQWTNREFVDLGIGATRRTRWIWGRGLVNLSPWDPRLITAVALNPESTVPTTLIADQDYSPTPPLATGQVGTYQYLTLSSWLIPTSTMALRMGYAYIDITATWGMASVPVDVQRAATITAAAQIDRSAASYGVPTAEDGRQTMPNSGGTFIPWGARKILQPYCRMMAVGQA